MQCFALPSHSARGLFLVGTLFELGTGFLALGLAWALGLNLPGPWFPMPADLLLVGGITGGAMILIGWMLTRLRWEPLEDILRRIVLLLGPLLREGRWWQWAVLSLAAGWGEELLFRGVLQGKLQQYLGLGPAVVAASVVFGAFHAVTPLYFVLATIVGGIFGLLFHYTGSLLPPVLAHAMYDFWALAHLSLRCRQESETLGEPRV